MEPPFPRSELRRLRESKGLTQQQLDQAAGLKAGTVRDYEQGVRSPAWSKVMALCAALGVDCTAFAVAAGDGEPQPAAAPPPEKRGRGRPKKADDTPPPPAKKPTRKKSGG